MISSGLGIGVAVGIGVEVAVWVAVGEGDGDTVEVRVAAGVTCEAAGAQAERRMENKMRMELPVKNLFIKGLVISSKSKQYNHVFLDPGSMPGGLKIGSSAGPASRASAVLINSPAES